MARFAAPSLRSRRSTSAAIAPLTSPEASVRRATAAAASTFSESS
jgi:hypothetical protein